MVATGFMNDPRFGSFGLAMLASIFGLIVIAGVLVFAWIRVMVR